ncbi:MAG TPA: hypothetical protein VGG29_11415 [Caulobacteraceae bacterium]|jgi:hypothetical protein
MAEHDPGHIGIAAIGLVGGLIRALVANGALTAAEADGIARDVLDQVQSNPDRVAQEGVIEVLRQIGLVQKL